MDAAKNQGGSGVKTWSFGNGYSVQDDNGRARYYYGAQEVTPGAFLEGTRGNTNWDAWKDIWNNGVSTNGVGSDTISAYQKVNPSGMSANDLLNWKNRYGYLYGY